MKTQYIFILLSLIFAFPFQGQGQLVSVSGYVNSGSTGKIKRNVTVFESHSGIGTITNREGYFRLLLKPGKQLLEFSSDGYESFTSEFILVADTILSVELTPLGVQNSKTEERLQNLAEPIVSAGHKDTAGKEIKQ